MFKYKTRTETINGCKFYEQDILLFDYSYSGDCVVEFVVDYNSPGFGLFLAKESNIDIVDSEDIYIFKLGDENEYQIINKQLLKQVYLRDEYILPGSDIRFPAKDLKLVFKFIDNCKIEAFVINKISSGEELETMLFEYEIPYFIDKYKIGVYSNSGNTLKHATIKSEAPSNWISNIANGNGGRISWIKNGFKIENCEHDCEVECQNIKLDPGKYYFDYKCNNQDMKCYIYLSEFENTNDRRPTEKILQTRIDDAKNILNYSDNSFELKEKSLINIRFKGKEGTVENIAIKRKKLDNFVETDYSTTIREASYINLNINNIKKVEMEAEIISFPLNEVDEEIDYSLFSSGNNNIDKHDFEYHDYTKILNYGIDVENGIVSINSDTTDKLKKEIQNKNTITILKNVDAKIHKLIVITNDDETIDILRSRTFKIIINKNIKTPIIITDENDQPFDLSSSYREVVDKKRIIEVFNKYSPIRLNHKMCLNDADVLVAGTNSSIDLSKNTIEESVKEPEIISTTRYTIDWKNNGILLDKDVKEKYKYIIIEYSHCDNYVYEFTNFERELFNLSETQNIFLSKQMCDMPGSNIVYAIPKGEIFFEDMIYRIPNRKSINSIDYCSNVYDILLDDRLKVLETGNVIFEDDIREKYDYVIIDYVKNNSYCINEKEDYYEIDIATNSDVVKTIYDSTKDDVINTYKKLNISNINENNFIVLRKD